MKLRCSSLPFRLLPDPRLTLLLLLLWQVNLWAQTPVLSSLQQALSAFEYQRVLTEGRSALERDELQLAERLRVLEFMLNAAYALNDTLQARTYAEAMVALAPDYLPDAKITSPKIAAFYSQSQQRAMRQKQIPASEFSSSKPSLRRPLPTPHLLASLALPGSGHLLNGKKGKGWAFSAASVSLLSGIIYTAHETAVREKAYLQATGDADYDRLYQRYNDAYRWRNSLLTGYALLAVVALYDLHAGWNRDRPLRLALHVPQQALMLEFQKKL